MTKQTAEWSNSLSIFWLKKYGYLNRDYSFQSGGITWTFSGGNKNSISFTIIKEDWGKPEERACVKLNYTNTSNRTGEKESMDYKIELATTPCRYGGLRYWFVCPLSKNGKYCGRRVGVIYGIGKWFGCRHCGEIAYAKQMEGGKYRWDGISISDIDRAKTDVKRRYYKGKPTRKYRRYLRLNNKFEMGYILMASRIDKSLARFVNPKK